MSELPHQPISKSNVNIPPPLSSNFLKTPSPLQPKTMGVSIPPPISTSLLRPAIAIPPSIGLNSNVTAKNDSIVEKTVPVFSIPKPLLTKDAIHIPEPIKQVEITNPQTFATHNEQIESTKNPNPEFQVPQFPQAPSFPPSSKKSRISKGESINSSILSSLPNSDITVSSGSYIESIIIDKSLQIVSDGEVTIESSGSSETIICRGSLVVMKGFVFNQNKSQGSGTISLESGESVFYNCTFKCQLMSALIAKGSSKAYFFGCKFVSSDSTAVSMLNDSICYFESCEFFSSKNNSFLMRGKSYAKFYNCSFPPSFKSSLVVQNNSQVIVEQTKFVSSGSNSIEVSSESSVIYINKCIFEKASKCGIYTTQNSVIRVIESIFNDCQGSSIESRHSSTVISTGNTFNNNNGCSSIFIGEKSQLFSSKDKFFGKMNVGIGLSNESKASIDMDEFCNLEGSGILMNEKASLIIKSSNFKNIRGSGIACSNGSISLFNVTMNDIGINGIILFKAEKSSFESLTIENCKNCAMIFEETQNPCSIQKSTFKNNQNGIQSVHSSFSLISSTFDSNEEFACLTKQSSCSISDVKFLNSRKACFFSLYSSINMESSLFTGNKECSLSIHDESILNINRCLFQSNEGGAVFISKSKTVFNETNIIKNGGNGLLIQDRSSVIDLNSCSIIENSIGAHIYHGSVSIKSSTFSQNMIHIEAQDGSNIQVLSSEFSLSKGKTGIHMSNGSSVSIDSCSLHDETQSAIITSGKLVISHSQMVNCGSFAIAFQQFSTGLVQENVLQKNGQCGIYVEAGKPTIQYNRIDDHALVGIKIGGNGEPEMKGNEFARNAVVNIERE